MTRTETAAWLRAHDHYRILTHRNPDGDTIGCASALCRGLRALGKDAAIYENPQFTARYDRWLSGLTAPDVTADHTIVSVDMASESLLPDNAVQFAGKIQLAMDHHGSNTGYAAATLVEPERAACGEIIAGLLEQLGVTPDKRTAEALYVAISTDTGCFRYSNVTADTLRIAAQLKDWGADTYPINKIMFQTRRLPRLQLEAYLVQHLHFYAGGRVGVAMIPWALRGQLGLTEDDLDDISGFARDIEGVEIGAMLRQQEHDGCKLSLRTSPRYDACAICARLGGGGHKAASGATVDTDPASAEALLLQAIRAEYPALFAGED